MDGGIENASNLSMSSIQSGNDGFQARQAATGDARPATDTSSTTPNARELSGLKVGQQLNARVVDAAGPNRIVLQIGDHRVLADRPPGVDVGSRIPVRVAQNAGQVVLDLVNQGPRSVINQHALATIANQLAQTGELSGAKGSPVRDLVQEVNRLVTPRAGQGSSTPLSHVTNLVSGNGSADAEAVAKFVREQPAEAAKLIRELSRLALNDQPQVRSDARQAASLKTTPQLQAFVDNLVSQPRDTTQIAHRLVQSGFLNQSVLGDVAQSHPEQTARVLLAMLQSLNLGSGGGQALSNAEVAIIKALNLGGSPTTTSPTTTPPVNPTAGQPVSVQSATTSGTTLQQLPNVLASASRVQALLADLVNADGRINGERLRQLIQTGGLSYEGKLAAALQNAIGNVSDIPQADLKGSLLQLFGQIHSSGAQSLLSGLSTAVANQVAHIEGQQASNLFAQASGQPLRVEIPMIVGPNVSTALLSVREDNGGGEQNDGSTSDKGKGYNILFLLDMDQLGQTRIDARIGEQVVYVTFYIEKDDGLKRTQTELPSFRSALKDELSYEHVVLQAKPLKGLSPKLRKEFDDLESGTQYNSVNLLDILA